MNMEFNPLKWFGGKQPEKKTSVEEIFPDEDRKISRESAKKFQKESRERKIRSIQLPSGVDEESFKKIVSSLEEAYKALRKEPKSIDIQTEIITIQNQMREALGNSAEAEVALANIDIDIEASLRKGTVDNLIYRTYQKLGDINVFDKVLRGKMPEWIEKHLPTLSKMAARSVSLRTALSATVVAGGGLVGSAIALPWLSIAVAAGIGGAAGFYAVRTLYKARKEKEYFKELGNIAALISERKGIDNLSSAEIKEFAESLIHGAHHLGKAIGLKEDGSADTESIAAQVLARYDNVLQEAGVTGSFEHGREDAFAFAIEEILLLVEKYSTLQPIKSFKNKTDRNTLKSIAEYDYITVEYFLKTFEQELSKNETTRRQAEHVRAACLNIAAYIPEEEKKVSIYTDKQRLDEALNNLNNEVEKRIENSMMSVRRQGLKDLLKYIRNTRTEEKLFGALGLVGGAVASTLIRTLIYFGTHGETIQDWWAKHAPDLFAKYASGAGEVLSTATERISDIISYVRGGSLSPEGISVPPIATPSATPSPDVTATPPATGVIEVSPIEEQGKVSAGFPGETDIKPAVPAESTVSEAVQSAKAARPSSLDDTTLANQYNFFYGEHGSKPESVERLAKLFKEQGIDFKQGIDGKTYDTLTARVGEGLSGKDKAEDHILMQFLGKIMSGTVHDTFGKASISGFPAEEKGALLNFMYNLRNDELLSFDKHTGAVTLKYNPEELVREYDEHSREHDWDTAKADDYAKKISSERWNRWFGFEDDGEKVIGETREPSLKRGIGAGKHVAVPAQENGVYELESKERLAAEKGFATDKNIDEAVQPSTSSVVPETVSAVATESVAAPSAPAAESIAAKVVSAGATESIAAEHVAPQRAGTPSVIVEQPSVPGKITGQAVEAEQKITKAAPKVAPQLSAAEIAQQAHRHMLDSLQKGKYAIDPYAVEQVEGLRLSTFLERVAEVKTGKVDMFSAFSSDQFSLKEYEKIVSYITEHEPNTGEKRMLLKNYLLSKEK